MFFKRSGFSLIEITIVMALSVVMIGVVAGVYAQRRNLASDDAAQQIASSIQTVRNEAKQGLGPTNGSTVTSGYTLFGEAIEFRNGCTGTQSCLRVYKLQSDGTNVSIYEQYDIATPEGFAFNLIANPAGDCSASFISCYSTTASNPLSKLTLDPIALSKTPPSPTSQPNLAVVIKNGTGDMYVFSKNAGSATSIGPSANSESNYIPSRQGILNLATAQLDGAADVQATWDNESTKYYINIDMTGNNTIKVLRK